MGRLDGKVVMITGGARGQGRSHAVTFAREGADVVVCDACEPHAEGVPYELASEADLRETERLVLAEGRRCIAMTADARSSEQLDAVVARALAELGRIDALCVSHGVFAFGSWEVSEAQWDAVVDVNMKGVWLACKAVIPHMVERGEGAITVTSSTAGLRGYYGCLPYVASKHGAVGVVHQLAPELAAHRIRINAVCPTTVNTPMVDNPPTLSLFAGGKENATPEDAAFPLRTMQLLPIQWIEAQDVSNALLWLISDDARYVTGIALPIDAGQLAQPAGVPPEAATLIAELSAT